MIAVAARRLVRLLRVRVLSARARYVLSSPGKVNP